MCFGDGSCDCANIIEATKGQSYYYGIRLYRPRDVDQARVFIDAIRANPIVAKVS